VEEVKVFDSRKVVGIYYYDIDETIEYLKIKDLDQDRTIAKTLKLHNKKIKKIEFLNTQNFNEIDLLMNLAFSGNVKPGEKPKEAEGKEYLKKVIPTVRKETRTAAKDLNDKMKEVLSEKQFKRWIKYLKKIKRDLAPKRPSAPIDNDPTGRSLGGRGAQGGIGGSQRPGF